MRKIFFMPLLAALVFGVSACKPAPQIAEAEYGAKIVGSWLGTVGDMKESITFSTDGNYVAQLRPMGFISNTLSQGVAGMISGTWSVNGRLITLNVTSAEDEQIKNAVTTSTIESFSPDELSVKSSTGEASLFRRETSL